jgi:hydroxymethylbilane synthase
MERRLVYATRRSKLALAQSRAFVKGLAALDPLLRVEELTVVTTGDRVQDRPLSEIGGKGLFVKEIEEALLRGEADIAVHSSKDLPAELASGLFISCVPLREDPRDVLVSRSGATLAELPHGARVGTTSLRRRVQLQAARPDLVMLPLRGNVDTRLRKCQEGEVDAIVLARAGLVRLGMADLVTEVIETDVCLPAVGQGALAIEQRIDDSRMAALLGRLSHADTAIAFAVERGFMVAVEGSCQTPVAAYAVREAGRLHLRAFLAEPDGTRARRGERREEWPATAAEAERIGRSLGVELRAR